MFSFAMTSGLASDSDKFKIIITLRRAQKFGDTGPYKNFDSKKISIPNGTVMYHRIYTYIRMYMMYVGDM